jgi:hypothetical protein
MGNKYIKNYLNLCILFISIFFFFYIFTGEYVLQTSNGEAELPLPLDDLFLDEGLNLAELENDLEEISKETLEENTEDLEDTTATDQESQELIEDILLSTVSEVSASNSSGNETKTETDISSLPSLDDTDELDLLCDMMMTSTAHFQHPRQPPQNYGHHSVNSFRQSGYHQVCFLKLYFIFFDIFYAC